jgi:hypothetical protein
MLHSRRARTLQVLPRTLIHIRNERTRISAKCLSSIGYSFLSISLAPLPNTLHYIVYFPSRLPFAMSDSNVRDDVIAQINTRSVVNLQVLNSDGRIPSGQDQDAPRVASLIDRERLAAAREIKIYDRPRDRVARAFSVVREELYVCRAVKYRPR